MNWRCALLLLGLVSGPAFAECQLQTPVISLGVLDPLRAPPPPVLVSLQATCSEPAVITVFPGKGSSGQFEPRTMRMGSEKVEYNLFTGTTNAVIWGDGTVGTAAITQVVNANEPVQILGNAQVYSGQDPTPGLYTDTVIFTVQF